jgi:DNA polymerase V
MMDARKLLINLLYLATAQSSELPGWSHRETKKPLQATVAAFQL